MRAGLPLALRIIAALLAHDTDRTVSGIAADLLTESARLTGLA
jgi:hypothetical protein